MLSEVVEYKIVQLTSRDDVAARNVQDEVNDLIALGWCLRGNLVITHGGTNMAYTYTQVMVRSAEGRMIGDIKK